MLQNSSQSLTLRSVKQNKKKFNYLLTIGEIYQYSVRSADHDILKPKSPGYRFFGQQKTLASNQLSRNMITLRVKTYCVYTWALDRVGFKIEKRAMHQLAVEI